MYYPAYNDKIQTAIKPFKYKFLKGSVYQKVHNWALDKDNNSFNFLCILKSMDTTTHFFFVSKLSISEHSGLIGICIKKKGGKEEKLLNQ